MTAIQSSPLGVENVGRRYSWIPAGMIPPNAEEAGLAE